MKDKRDHTVTGNLLIIMKYSYLFKLAKLFSNLCFQCRGILSIFDCHKILENYGCYLYKGSTKFLMLPLQ